ncbi:septum formation family protein [Antribacter sp. KLBMP9083]|uniref:Septum formation family protein n=1 Tax=Antribacter soli TaxID=2910976 RepID=A0AA41QIN0_9MICO|nr:septum formation family protein [Antribacter soli]MCF4123731.1 septum formation family protein [Antribacter soli]
MTSIEAPVGPRSRRRVVVGVCVGALVLAASGAAAAVVALGQGPDARADSLEVDWLDLLPGDCYVPEQVESYPVPEESSTVEVVPCDEPHGAEVLLVDVLPDGPWPGEAENWKTAWSRCIPAFEDFAGVPYEEPNTALRAAPPTEQSWGDGDRMLACMIVPGYDVTGSMRGRGAELVAP